MFAEWVQAQADRPDQIGEPARRVPDWPRGRPRLDELHAHLEIRGADGWDMGDAHQALDEAGPSGGAGAGRTSTVVLAPPDC
jgi:hypothetical protein